MIKVKVFNKETPEHAIKRLRRRLQKEGTLQSLFERRFFKSEGEKRREIIRRAKYINKMKHNNQ